MGKLAFLLLACLSVRCAWSYYQNAPQPYQPRIIYRHHIAPYQPRASYMQPVMLRPPAMPYGGIPVAYGPPELPFQRGAATPVSMYLPQPQPQPVFTSIPYAPAAAHVHSFFRQSPPPPRTPRYPLKQMVNPFQSAFSQYPAPSTMFGKIKPFLFGNTGPRSLPHHPYFPNMYPPHNFIPNRPLQNRPVSHLSFPVYQESGSSMKSEKSCSCSLHVGELTVYKHTDVRSSYSCTDLKDCNSFCTNLFSSEDLRAQTRSDACLILGKDVTVPWFRRDAVCEPHGTKNDTKLSVDLCCKNLQPC
ncbi:uncharacterized protein [Parasteatoda tepidariorum]|uniref:uncharacterized protein n=1 Tax=Parasteatoda tepidariorum TaxID=114398 RepID=UPI001C719CCB|nr:leucine-rich repeat extensin-like protein 3 [Parasteatoda tepidariorum]